MCFHDGTASALRPPSLHDALPIFVRGVGGDQLARPEVAVVRDETHNEVVVADRKSTRLNSSHRCSSYAVFCLKKKNDMLAAAQRRRSLGADLRSLLCDDPLYHGYA